MKNLINYLDDYEYEDLEYFTEKKCKMSKIHMDDDGNCLKEKCNKKRKHKNKK